MPPQHLCAHHTLTQRPTSASHQRVHAPPPAIGAFARMMCEWVGGWVYMCVCVCVHACVHACEHACVCVPLCTCTRVCVRVHVRAQVCVMMMIVREHARERARGGERVCARARACVRRRLEESAHEREGGGAEEEGDALTLCRRTTDQHGQHDCEPKEHGHGQFAGTCRCCSVHDDQRLVRGAAREAHCAPLSHCLPTTGHGPGVRRAWLACRQRGLGWCDQGVCRRGNTLLRRSSARLPRLGSTCAADGWG